MRLGESGVSVCEVRAGSDFGMKDALRGIGLNPVRPGWYVVTIEKVSEARAREVLADLEMAENAPVCNCEPTPAMKAANIHRSSCARLGGDGS